MTDQRDLRDVRREQAAERRRMKEQRERARQRLDQTTARANSDEADRIRRHNAVVLGLVPRIAGAIDSWAAKRVPLEIQHPARRFHAVTNFQSISINVPATENVDLDFAADLRGLAYHEAGHILKSMPYPVLLDTVMPLDDDARPYDRDRSLNKMTGLDTGTLHRAWNMLEDQRMESAMVRESANLGRYYNVIVLEHVLQASAGKEEVSTSAYCLLYGRKHVDPSVRAAARAAMVAAHSEATVVQAEKLIDTYKQSNDPLILWESVVRFAYLVGGLLDAAGLNSVDDHENYYQDEGDFDLDDSAEPVPAEQSEGEPPKEGKGADGPADKDESEEGDEDGKHGAPADRRAHGDVPDKEPVLGSSKSINDPDWDRQLIRHALNEAREVRNQDGNVLNDVKAYHHALHDARSSVPAARIPYTCDPDPTVTTGALKLNRSIRNIMEQARAEHAPSWQTGQRRGVLDVRSYLTRQVGDMEFYRDYAPGGDMKLPDMAVSLVLDGSASMDHRAQELAIAAFGIKSACDVVNVPCTVTVYDTDVYLLWDKDDQPLDVPYNIVPSGGTEPKRALDLLDFQKYDKKNHLVIIMTDGAWSHEWRRHLSLAHYAAPDRDLVMFYLGCDPLQGPAGADQCSLVQRIDDLQEMPRFLQRYILRAL